jgi:hypothetical protein
MIQLIKTLLEKVDVLRFLTAFTIMAVFFIITNALIYREIPEGNKEILIHLLGIVEGAVMTVVTYEFGSSKGSDRKSDMLNKREEPKL